jgi:hypothetical protein
LVGQQEFDEGDDAEMPEGDYTVQVSMMVGMALNDNFYV